MTLTHFVHATRMRRPDRKRSAGRVDARPIARGMRREPEPFRRCGRAFVFRGRRPSHKRMCHEQDSDHQRAALHQRRQAPRQSRRLASARGCACAFPPPARRRGIVHLRHRRARHAGGARRDRGRRGRAALLRCAACDPGGHLSPLRLVVRSFRPLVLPAEPCIDPAFLPTARCRRPDRGAPRAPGVVVGRPALPARPLRLGTCPHCGSAAARGDQCDAAGRLLDPADLAAAALGAVGRHATSNCARAVIASCANRCWWIASMPGSAPARGGRRSWPRWRGAGSRRTCAIAASPAISAGACRCRARANKVFYVWFDAPIAYIAATQEWAERRPCASQLAGLVVAGAMTSATSSSWARTTCRSTR